MAPFALGYRETMSMSMSMSVGPAGMQARATEDSATRAIRRFYFGNRDIGPFTRENLTNLFSDRNFFQCTRMMGLKVARYAPVYLYYLTQEGDVSWLDVFHVPKELGKT